MYAGNREGSIFTQVMNVHKEYQIFLLGFYIQWETGVTYEILNIFLPGLHIQWETYLYRTDGRPHRKH